MKQLFVLRHAKSSWDDPGLEDHERPLAPRGRRAVKLLARHVRDNGIEPALVLCSSAVRARDTCEGVIDGGELQVESGLYDATAGELLERLRRVSDAVPSAMVVGHNPTLQMLVLKLAAGNGEAADGEVQARIAEVQRKFPTAALATLQFDCTWSELSPGCATLAGLVRPRDLH